MSPRTPIALLAALICTGAAHAQVMRCVDAAGRVSYTDGRCPDHTQAVEIEPAKTPEQLEAEREQAEIAQRQRLQRQRAWQEERRTRAEIEALQAQSRATAPVQTTPARPSGIGYGSGAGSDLYDTSSTPMGTATYTYTPGYPSAPVYASPYPPPAYAPLGYSPPIYSPGYAPPVVVPVPVVPVAPVAPAPVQPPQRKPPRIANPTDAGMSTPIPATTRQMRPAPSTTVRALREEEKR